MPAKLVLIYFPVLNATISMTIQTSYKSPSLHVFQETLSSSSGVRLVTHKVGLHWVKSICACIFLIYLLQNPTGSSFLVSFDLKPSSSTEGFCKEPSYRVPSSMLAEISAQACCASLLEKEQKLCLSWCQRWKWYLTLNQCCHSNQKICCYKHH